MSPKASRGVWVAVVIAAFAASACGSVSQPTTSQPIASSLTISTPTPAAGSVIPATPTGGSFLIARGSGLLSIPIALASDRDLPYSQLSVYLFDGTGTESYCGQNLPDAPTWGGFSKGQTLSVTISGFQVFRVPCQVTSVRAWFHTRNNGLLIPPNASETVAQASLAVTYTIR